MGKLQIRKQNKTAKFNLTRTTKHKRETGALSLSVYEGGIIYKLKIDFDKWSYFEFVGIVKELSYRKINTIWYKDPTFWMNVLIDDKGALDIAKLCKVHLSVNIYI